MATQDSIDVTKYADLPATGVNYASTSLQLIGIERVNVKIKINNIAKERDP